jgi:hypothetical protein
MTSDTQTVSVFKFYLIFLQVLQHKRNLHCSSKYTHFAPAVHNDILIKTK